MPPKSKKLVDQVSPKSVSPKNKTKRCPKGEYRNPKTGLCEKKGEKEDKKADKKSEMRQKPRNLSKMTLKEKDIYEKRKSCIDKYRRNLPSLTELQQVDGEGEQEPESKKSDSESPKSAEKLKSKSKSKKNIPKSAASNMTILEFHSKSKLLPKSSPLPPTAARDLSNFSKHDVEYEGKIYPTVEHAFQAQKGGCLVDKKGQSISEDKKTEFIEKVRALDTAEQAKSAGGKGAMKKEDIYLDIKCWDSKRNEIMDALIRSKVERHADIRKILDIVKEEKIRLVHFSRMDMEWGAHVDKEIGEIKEGKNKLGELYMSLL